MIEHTVKLVRNGVLSEKDIRDSFKRIVLLKEKYDINNNTNFVGVNVNLVNYNIQSLNEDVDKYLDGR